MKINTTETVAAKLGISKRRAQQLAAELNLTPQRIGRQIIFSDEQVKIMERRKTQRGPAKKKEK